MHPPGGFWWATPMRAPRKGRGEGTPGAGERREGTSAWGQPFALPVEGEGGSLGAGRQAGRRACSPQRKRIWASAAPAPAGTLLAGPLSLLLPILPFCGLENQSVKNFSPCPETDTTQLCLDPLVAPPGGPTQGWQLSAPSRLPKTFWKAPLIIASLVVQIRTTITKRQQTQAAPISCFVLLRDKFILQLLLKWAGQEGITPSLPLHADFALVQ